MKVPATILLPFLYISLILVLLVSGLLFVFEASGPESFSTFGNPFTLTFQHAIGIGLGSVLFVAGLLIPIKIWFRLKYVIYFLAIFLLAATFFPGLGLEINGAHRWLDLGVLVFQPVELMKLAMIILSAAWMTTSVRISPLIATLILPAVIIMIQPDLGSLLIVAGIVVSMFFIAGGEIRQLSRLAMLVIPILLLLIVIEPYRLQRLTTYLNPDSDPQGKSFHVRQLTLALGRGGLLGQGLGNSSQKFSYVPEASTDSIAAIIGEETGFIGLSFLAILYICLASIGVRMLSGTTGPVRLLGQGILIWLILQVVLNIAAVSALVPLTGIPLPLISYGRSSLVMLLFALGILLRIYLEQRKKVL